MPSKRAKEQTGGESMIIDDKQQRINTKSKRKRTLIRKGIEVSQKCSLDILIVIRDKETNKIYEYNSGKPTDALFTFLEVSKLHQAQGYHSIVYTDMSYDALTPSYSKPRRNLGDTVKKGNDASENFDSQLKIEGPLFTSQSLKVQKIQ